MRVENHLLTTATYTPSPFFNERPNDAIITMLVIHNISLPPGVFGGPYIAQLFTNHLDLNADPSFAEIKDSKVSAHLLIDRLGHITQFVPFNLRAWHAGISTFCGHDNCNDYSIGIELEGSDFVPFTEAQYEQLIAVIKTLFATYPTLRPEQIVGHEHIAPGRKTDPGPYFDWHRILTLV